MSNMFTIKEVEGIEMTPAEKLIPSTMRYIDKTADAWGPGGKFENFNGAQFVRDYIKDFKMIIEAETALKEAK